jgi:hypothetical protein
MHRFAAGDEDVPDAVRLDIPRRHPARVERQDLPVKPLKPPLTLAHQLRLETAFPISGRVDPHRPVLGHQRLRAPYRTPRRHRPSRAPHERAGRGRSPPAIPQLLAALQRAPVRRADEFVAEDVEVNGRDKAKRPTRRSSRPSSTRSPTTTGIYGTCSSTAPGSPRTSSTLARTRARFSA